MCFEGNVLLVTSRLPSGYGAEKRAADLLKVMERNGCSAVRHRTAPNGATALHLAAVFASTEMVEILSRSIPVDDATTTNGVTPLHNAVLGRNVENAIKLLTLGASPNIAAHNGTPPIFSAIHMRDMAMVDALLKGGASPVGYKDPNGASILSAAAQLCPVEVVSALLARGARADDGDDVDVTGWTPLHRAVHRRALDIVEVLLVSGASANAAHKRHRMTPLHTAANIGLPSIVGALLAHGGSVSVRDDMGASPLTYAVIGNHVEAAKLLLRAGADPNGVLLSVAPAHSYLSSACGSGLKEMAELLIAAGARVTSHVISVAELEDFSAKVASNAKKTKTTTAEFLRSSCSKYVQGETILSMAVDTRDEHLVKMLLQRGADPDTVLDGEGDHTPRSRWPDFITDDLVAACRIEGLLCVGCGSINDVVKFCSGCRVARYCSPACQTKDWQRHNQECCELNEQRRAVKAAKQLAPT